MNHYKNLKLKIFNSLGVEVKRLSVNGTDITNLLTLYRAGLKSGIYNTQILDKGNVLSVTKLMVE